MLAASSDTTALKMIVQNNGRKVIQEVNRIKWLLGMAETNHYALYNAQQYLAHCSTPPRCASSSSSSYYFSFFFFLFLHGLDYPMKCPILKHSSTS